jgi:type I restriction enzyme R subunit
LRIFDPKDLGHPMENIDAIFRKMLDYKEAVMRIFAGVDRNNIDDLMNVLKPEDKRAEFEVGYKRFASAVNALMPTHTRTEDLNDLKWLSYIRAGAKARFQPENPIDISDCGEKARELISEHLKSKGVAQWIKPITLFDKGFLGKIENLGSDEAIASSMEHAIKHAIKIKMKENPVHYTSLLERLKKILEDADLNWKERKDQLQNFILVELEHGEEELSQKLGFTEKRQLALFETVNAAIQARNEKDGIGFESDTDLLEKAKGITNDIEQAVLDSRVKGFSHNQTRTDEISRAIYDMLLQRHYEVFGFDAIQQIISPLIELAKIHYDDME